MLVEALVPHEAVSVVRSVWHDGKQSAVSLFDDFAVLEDHPVTMHVGHAAQHVA